MNKKLHGPTHTINKQHGNSNPTKTEIGKMKLDAYNQQKLHVG